MAGYQKLTETKEQMLIGRVSHLYDEGYTPSEISGIVQQPLTRVNKWIKLSIAAKDKTDKGV